MDKVLGVHQKKSCKPKLLHQQQQKGKKKKEDQVKVVYISNPVNFNTSASEFRSLVQQLTGRDSSGHQYIDGGRRELKAAVNENPVFKEEHEHAINGAAETTISEVGITSSSLINSNLDSLLDDHHVYDDVSMSHIFDSLLPSNIWYNNSI